MIRSLFILILFTAFFSSNASAYCAANGNNTSYEYIQSVSVNGDLRNSGNNNGYLNDANVINLSVGDNSFVLTPGFPGNAYTERWVVWVDLNQNGSYEPSERLRTANSSSAVNTTITLPSATPLGTTGMRIAMRYGSTPTPCGSFTWGEVEDYTVNIEAAVQEYPHHLTLSYDFYATRTGDIGDPLVWNVEKDGVVVLQRNAAGELRYRYFANAIGSDYRIWLTQFIGGQYQQVSNVVEYTPGVTDLYELTLGNNYLLQRSGSIGDALQWVIEKDGNIVLQRNAANELSYTYFNNSVGSKFRVWLKQFINGEYKIVSNTVEYEAGAFDNFQTLTLGSNFEVTRTGDLYGGYTWVIERNGSVVLRRNADGEMSYTYFNNTNGSDYRVWLEIFHNGQYVVASNIVSYTPGITDSYQLTLGPGFQLNRSGSIGESVQWVIEKNGNIVLQRNASNELSYTYFSNTPGSTIRAWLQKFVGGYYQQVSNIVTYNP